MGDKVILVLVDGLGLRVALTHFGYMEGLVAAGAARRWHMRACLPSMSRPLYATVLTGVVPHEHGITTNDDSRALSHPSVFSEARQAGRRTAAAAHSWVSELCNRTPYHAPRDCEVDDEALPIQHGRFYESDDYPDSELFAKATMLAERRAPDVLLLHPMGVDSIGHLHGGESPQYHATATGIDTLLARHAPGWRNAGYDVVVTADHGMDAHGHHGGTLDIHLDVPFYWAPAKPENGFCGGVDDHVACQTAVAPTVLRLLGLAVSSSMPTAPLA